MIRRTARERIVQILTCMGWVGAAYPYAPGKVTGKDVVKALCGEEQTMRKRTKDGRTRGLPKATRAARRRAAEAVASLGSVDEAQRFLADVGGMSAGRGTDYGDFRARKRLIPDPMRSCPSGKASDANPGGRTAVAVAFGGTSTVQSKVPFSTLHSLRIVP